MKTNKKKVIVLCCMVALLVITGVLSVVLDGKLKDAKEGPVLNPGDESYFAAFRSDKETARSASLAILDAIIKDEASTQEAVAQAEAQKLKICSIIEKEVILEGLIKAKGFEEVVVTLDGDKASIIVKSDKELTAEDSKMINYFVVKQTGIFKQNIEIHPFIA